MTHRNRRVTAGRRIRSWVATALGIGVLLACAAEPASSQTVRVATYNIKVFKESVSSQRINRLKEVISELDAHVIALQEIESRTALKRLFDPDDWHIIIDDDSKPSTPGHLDQDVALVVRKEFDIVSPDDLEAEDEDFLFPSGRVGRYFPNRRDVLHVRVKFPQLDDPVSFLVMHLKARNDGRFTTTPRRVGAAELLVDALETDFDDVPFVLLGDFNDGPDDKSSNILETADDNAVAEDENNEGPFLINLTEPLVAADMISYALNFGSDGGRVAKVVHGSRDKNFDNRHNNVFVKKVLLDQILISVSLKSSYVAGSAGVFAPKWSHKSASDHLPVFADFTFGDDEHPAGNVNIVALMPNPSGRDVGNEYIRLKNVGNDSVNLDDWTLIDESENTVSLVGTLASGEELKIVLGEDDLRLTNSGDTIRLLNDDGNTVDSARYSAADVSVGEEIAFP